MLFESLMMMISWPLACKSARSASIPGTAGIPATAFSILRASMPFSCRSSKILSMYAIQPLDLYRPFTSSGIFSFGSSFRATRSVLPLQMVWSKSNAASTLRLHCCIVGYNIEGLSANLCLHYIKIIKHVLLISFDI